MVDEKREPTPDQTKDDGEIRGIPPLAEQQKPARDGAPIALWMFWERPMKLRAFPLLAEQQKPARDGAPIGCFGRGL